MSEQKLQQMEEEKEHLISLGSLNISQMIKASQSANGLKRSEYGRYRKYCVKRVKTIRKTMKFSFGKRYQNKNIVDDRKNDPRILQVLLFNAEKNWAHAMSLKSLMTSEVKRKNKTNRMKYHLVNKFKKAVKWSRNLQKVCETRTENRTSLEAQAYATFLEGMYYFEIEQWEKAQNSYLKSRSIYTEILKISDSLQSVLYNEKVESIDQSIRYCSHKVSKGKSSMTMENILEMKQTIKDPSLISKLEELLDDHRQQQVEKQQGLLEVTYHGQNLPIKNPRAITLMQKISETNFNVSQNKEKINQYYIDPLGDKSKEILEILEQNFDHYIQQFSLYDDATKTITKDKDDAKNSEAEKSIFVKVLSYLALERQMAVLDRNDSHVKQAVLKFVQEDGLNNLQNLSTRRAIKNKLSTPQEIVKHCDNYQLTLKQIMDVERMNPDLSLFKKLDVQEFFCKAVRCFFVGCLYFSNGKFKESVSLLTYADGLFKTASRKYAENLTLFTNNNLEQTIKFFPSLTSKLQVQNKLSALKEQHSQQQNIGEKMGKMSLEQKQEQNQLERKSLFNFIQDKETYGGITFENVLNYRPADLTSQLSLIVPKSIQFDLAYNRLSYPQLEEKKDDLQKKGFWGKFNIFKK